MDPTVHVQETEMSTNGVTVEKESEAVDEESGGENVNLCGVNEKVSRMTGINKHLYRTANAMDETKTKGIAVSETICIEKGKTCLARG